jgi:DNA polymerase-3 subunit beta
MAEAIKLTEATTSTAIRVDRAALLTALQALAVVKARSSSLPILACALVEPYGSHLTLTATDLDVRATLRVDAEATGRPTVVPIALALKVLAQQTATTVTISAKPDRVTFDFVDTQVHLGTQPVQDFPALSSSRATAIGRVSAAVLGRLCGRAAVCVTSEDTRYFLDGGQLIWTTDSLRVTATDGHCLITTTGPATTTTATECLVRSRALRLLARLAHDDGPVEVSSQEHAVVFAHADWTIQSRAIDATFPAWDRVLPQNPHALDVSRSALLQAINRIRACANARSHAVYLQIEANVLRLASWDGTVGAAKTAVPCRLSGVAIDQIVLNHRYLTDGLTACLSDEVRITWKDARSQIAIVPVGHDDSQVVIMPMQV